MAEEYGNRTGCGERRGEKGRVGRAWISRTHAYSHFREMWEMGDGFLDFFPLSCLLYVFFFSKLDAS